MNRLETEGWPEADGGIGSSEGTSADSTDAPEAIAITFVAHRKSISAERYLCTTLDFTQKGTGKDRRSADCTLESDAHRYSLCWKEVNMSLIANIAMLLSTTSPLSDPRTMK